MNGSIGLPKNMRSPVLARGMTLIEVIAVIAILGIIATMSTAFVVNTWKSYRDVRHRTQITQQGRMLIERISRELRSSVPGSLRVSNNGNCLGFYPISASGRYLGSINAGQNINRLALQSLAFTAYSSGTSSHTPSAQDLANFRCDLNSCGAPVIMSVGAVSFYHVDNSGNFTLSYQNPGNWVVINDFTTSPNEVVFNEVAFSNHQFNRDSSAERVYFMHDPTPADGLPSSRFCVNKGELRLTEYRWLTQLSYDHLLSKSMASNANGAAIFQLQQGSSTRNMVVSIHLPLVDPTEQQLTPITFNQQVMVRNAQ